MLKQQLAWEQECVDRGSIRYLANQDRMKENLQGDQTDAVKYLFQKRLRGIANRIEALSNVAIGMSGQYNKVLKTITVDQDFLKIAYVGAQCTFQSLTHKKPSTLLKVVLAISKRLEADLKCTMFQAEYPGYYHTVMNSFDDNNVSGYEHKHNVLMVKFKEFDIDWEPWTPAMKVQLGGKVLRCIMEEFWDVLFISKKLKGMKTTSMLETTPVFDDWLVEFERERGFLLPELLPLKCKPAPWTDLRSGGYYSPQLRNALSFIKTKSKEHREHIQNRIPKKHMEGVNKIQNTAWKINREVLHVQQQIYRKDLGVGVPSRITLVPPPFPEHLKINKEHFDGEFKADLIEWKSVAKRVYAKELTRKGQLMAFMQAQKLAVELQHWDKFYFAFNCDFRGRVYCATSGLSPQGADSAKGLLTFAKGVRLGTEGIYWLAIHGANTYGVDKVSFDERVEWVKSNEEMWRAVVDDPISNREIWANADKPYQFLAFCFEWGKCNYGKNEELVSHLPVGLDGSCNGLQHFSAMLRDEVGANATNLQDGDAPQDIYQQVADRCTERLSEMDSAYARRWLRVGISRKCAKRPVMTLPYGATQQSTRHYIMEYAVENWDKFGLPERYQWDFAKFLTPILWASIGDIVVAARTCMKWLQSNTGKRLVNWTTPIGFPVFQCYKEVPATRVTTQICGQLTLFYRDLDKEGEPNPYLQRNGISPNFVHSLDSTHMILTVLNTNLHSYAMIHDDFGTHAGNIPELYKAIRTQFHALYTESCPLESWALQQGLEVTAVPEKYNYNLDEVLNAKYFFA